MINNCHSSHWVNQKLDTDFQNIWQVFGQPSSQKHTSLINISKHVLDTLHFCQSLLSPCHQVRKLFWLSQLSSHVVYAGNQCGRSGSWESREGHCQKGLLPGVWLLSLDIQGCRHQRSARWFVSKGHAVEPYYISVYHLMLHWKHKIFKSWILLLINIYIFLATNFF